ncbi:MAG: hypothetical protein EAZ17_00005, partial [Sphingobacteriales bacterium]
MFSIAILTGIIAFGQKKKTEPVVSPSPDLNYFLKTLQWRNIGPFRGGRSVAATGVRGNDQIYYMGTTGGGV